MGDDGTGDLAGVEVGFATVVAVATGGTAGGASAGGTARGEGDGSGVVGERLGDPAGVALRRAPKDVAASCLLSDAGDGGLVRGVDLGAASASGVAARAWLGEEGLSRAAGA